MLKKTSIGVSFWLLAASVQAETVAEIVQKHIDARGGIEAWEKVESIELTGDFTAFSKIEPFRLVRQKERKYFLDHYLGDKPVAIGFDGDTLWWDNHWFQQGAQKMTEAADVAVVERDLDFPTPFFDLEARGHKVEKLDIEELEGSPVIALELTRSDESAETWYLDPTSYLEIARDSPGSDFGRAMQQRTFFDDFRDVDGVLIPFYTETQWYTRHRVMEVHNAVINGTVDPAIFSMPLPPGMSELLSLAGDWNVAVESRNSPRAPWSEGERTSAISSRLGGAMIEESYLDGDGVAVTRSLSYDRAREHWVLTSIDERTGLLDIQIGKKDDVGVLTLSNLETGTSRENFGFVVYEKSLFFPSSNGGFRMERHNSIDEGETWFPTEKLSYSKATETSGP